MILEVNERFGYLTRWRTLSFLSWDRSPQVFHINGMKLTLKMTSRACSPISLFQGPTSLYQAISCISATTVFIRSTAKFPPVTKCGCEYVRQRWEDIVGIVSLGLYSWMQARKITYYPSFNVLCYGDTGTTGGYYGSELNASLLLTSAIWIFSFNLPSVIWTEDW